MPLTVLRDGAAPVILSNGTVFKKLPDDINVIELLGAIHTGVPVPVTFRDGSKVHLTTLDPQLPMETPRQLALTYDPDNRAFELCCKILVPLDATVHCCAPNKLEAARKVKDIFAGTRLQDGSFRVEVNRDETAETFHRVEGGLTRGIAWTLCAHDVVINRIEER
jgi:hypothetical protein